MIKQLKQDLKINDYFPIGNGQLVIEDNAKNYGENNEVKVFFVIKKNLKKTNLYKRIYQPLRRKYIKNLIKNDPVVYIVKRYNKVVGRTLNLDSPVTYTEKIQWRKVYDNNPLYTLCADKVAVRGFIKNLQEKSELDADILFFPQWYGVYDDFEAIDFQKLPNKFVLKSNHASGQIVICNDKNKINAKETKRQLKEWINTNYYFVEAEKHYKNIKPKIICEELLDSNIIDYRIFCFDGEPYLIKVTQHNNNAVGGYDEATFYTNWEKADIVWNKQYGKLEIEKPVMLDVMLEIARVLSGKFSFVRVDLYNYRGKIYFSELTFTPNSGLERNLSYEWDKKLGDKFRIK